ncbi:MAG: hypothetical protein ACR2RL_12460 [Gammaproteobacteria bacterium]
MNTHTAQRTMHPEFSLHANEIVVDPDVWRLLSQRYGDGLVYLNDSTQRVPFHRAVRLGLVNPDGYLTAAGQALVNRHRFD